MTALYEGHWVDEQPAIMADGVALPLPFGLCDEDGDRALLDWRHEHGAVCLAVAIIRHRLQAMGASEQESIFRAHDLCDEFASRLIAEFPADRWELTAIEVDLMIVEIEQEQEHWRQIYLSTT